MPWQDWKWHLYNFYMWYIKKVIHKYVIILHILNDKMSSSHMVSNNPGYRQATPIIQAN